MKVRACELCNGESSVFCRSDSAFLCWKCDAKVHEANFLVARHLRRTVCSNCNNFTGDIVSGVSFRPYSAACASCPPPSDDDLNSASSSSVCISSTSSPAKECSGVRRVKRRMRSKVEGIFVNWCGKLGLETELIVETACRGLGVCVERWPGLAYRVCLAASIWLGLGVRVDKSDSALILKRLELISGVPAKIILAVHSKLERLVRRRQLQHQLQEGWDES